MISGRTTGAPMDGEEEDASWKNWTRAARELAVYKNGFEVNICLFLIDLTGAVTKNECLSFKGHLLVECLHEQRHVSTSHRTLVHRLALGSLLYSPLSWWRLRVSWANQSNLGKVLLGRGWGRGRQGKGADPGWGQPMQDELGFYWKKDGALQR